jgi:hypothetical protein
MVKRGRKGEEEAKEKICEKKKYLWQCGRSGFQMLNLLNPAGLASVKQQNDSNVKCLLRLPLGL